MILLGASLVIHYCREKMPLQFNKNNLFAGIGLVLFYAWLLITLSFTPSKSYSYQKAYLFIPNIIAFAYPLVLKKFDITKFFRVVSLILPVISVVFVSVYLDYSSSVKSNVEDYDSILGLYLVCSTLLGINVLVIACSEDRIFRSSLLSTGVLTVSLLMMLILGARGPLLFCLLLLLLFMGYRFIKALYLGTLFISEIKKIIYGILVICIFWGMSFFFGNEMNYLLKRSLVRFELLMPSGSDSNMGHSVDVRVDQLNFGMELITDNFHDSVLGYGIGSFGVLHNGIDGRSYPHNIFLEIWIEAGLLGLLVFLVFLWMVFTKNLNGIRYISIVVLVYVLLNSLKSSSYIDIRVYFAIFGMYILNTNAKNLYVDSRNTSLQRV